jgi:filamentous hemagglutinin family protein
MPEPGLLQPRAADGRLLKPRLLISAIACLLPAAALAGPRDGQVVAGQASISTPDANTTVITQTTDKSIIHWQSFSVGGNEYVKFTQPATSSISLNRVIGGDPSSILGKLSANGQVYLVNPNGIYFGQGVQVDVSGIVASVLDISNDNFMSGNFVFERGADATLGKVINDGVINARNAGYVVLMGDYTQNNGVIQAQLGKVVLASGSRVTMDISGNNLISVAVDEAAVSELAGVDNSGEIYADGGRVIMTAKVADELIGTAVNNRGLVRANSIVEKDGAIFLTGSGGDISNSGTLDASAASGSSVDGGGVLVYSDRDITLSTGSEINARGDGSGAGGVVRVIAGEHLDFDPGAGIDVGGATQKGGFVELSGHGGLALRGVVRAGSGGTLLVDPATLTITSGSNSPGFTTGGSSATAGFVGRGYIEQQLNLNTNVTLVASNSIGAATGTYGSFTISASGTGDLSVINGTLGGTGTLGNCTLTGVCLPGGGGFGVIQGATGNINLGSVGININGSLNVAAGTGSGTVAIGAINAAGKVSITAGTNVNLQGQITGAGTSLAVSAGNDINVNGGIGSSATGLNATVNLNAGHDVVVDSDIFSGNSDINLNADVDGNNIGDVLINGSTSEARRILTAGDLNVSGQNFSVNGADFGTGSVSTNQAVPVNIKANRVIVNINGDMTVKGGRVNLGVNLGTTGSGGTTKSVDTSVKVTGTSLVNITASNLTVQGGTAAASVSGSFYASSVKAFANAELAATGGNMTVSLSGSLDLQAGSATAMLFDKSSSDVVLAEANASLQAGGAVTIVAPNGVSVAGGNALASAQGNAPRSTTGSNTPARAVADATLDAGTSLGLTIASGSLQIQGGNATAGVTFSSGSFRAAEASANALVTSGGNTTIAIGGGGLSVSGGFANASVSASGSNDAMASAFANAGLQVGVNLNVTSVATDVAIGGGSAIARMKGSAGNSTCSTCDARAQANASVQAAGAITIANVGGNFDLSTRAAQANIRVNTYLESSAQMQANADATLSGGTVNITAAGSLTVAAGRAIASGSWTSGTVQAKAHADALLEAVASSVTLTASTVNVDGGRATVGGSSSLDGDNGTLEATAKADIGAVQDVIIVATNGLAVSAGNALASFSDFNDTISGNANADARVQAGRDINLTLGGGLGISGGSATAVVSGRGAGRGASANAQANGELKAARDIIINQASGLTLNGGDASAALDGTSASCLSCGAVANAMAMLSAQSIRSVSVIAGDVNIAGGRASGLFSDSGDGTFSFANATVKADARALVTATQNVTLDASGSINVFGGSADLRGDLGSAASLSMDASASVLLSAGGSIALNAGGSNNLFGGFASVAGNWSSAGTVAANARANAGIAAANNVTMTSNTELNVFGGLAAASPSNTGSSGMGAASAAATATVSAGGLATFNVTAGSMYVFDGSANPPAAIAGSPPTSADANAMISVGAMDIAVSGNLNLISGGGLAATAGMMISAGVDVFGSSASIVAGGLNMSAGSNIQLVNTTTTIGSGAAPGITGDSLLLDIMTRAGIPLPAGNDPNARFTAGGAIVSGDVIMSAANSYLWFSADELTVDSIAAPAGPLLVQYSPFTPTLDIVFEDLPTSTVLAGSLLGRPLQVNYDNLSHVGSLPMTTVAIGSAQQSGPITVGANGPIDIGARNIVLLTTPDNVNSAANIITTGIVATSGFVASVGAPEVFVPPRLDSIRVESDTWWLEQERRKQRLIESRDDDDNGMCSVL